MGFLHWVVGAGVAGHLIKKVRQSAREAAEERAEQERRKSTPCRFIDGFSEYEFEQMVKRASKSIRRVSEVSVDGPNVYGVVQSQSGISEWKFKLDFNDYGHITGTFWCSSDNDDSNIPERLGEMIKNEINHYSSGIYYEEDDETPEYGTYQRNGYCPYCGKQLTVRDALFCTYCGGKLR